MIGCSVMSAGFDSRIEQIYMAYRWLFAYVSFIICQGTHDTGVFRIYTNIIVCLFVWLNGLISGTTSPN